MSEFYLVSVIVVTHNRPNKLKTLLESLTLDNYPEKEIIIVDNASMDNTTNIVKEYSNKFTNIKYIKNDKNDFPAKGRNLGARYAKGRYLFFIDDDGVATNNSIRELVEVLENDEKVGLVAPIILYWNSYVIWCAGGYNDLFTSLTKYLHNGEKIKNTNIPKHPYEIDHMPHAFMARKECFDMVGGFYEKYLIMYEESELAIRIKKLGYNVLAVSSAIAYHNTPVEATGSRRWGVHRRDRVYLLARNRAIFMKRNAPKIYYIMFLLTFNWVITLYYLYVLLRLGKIKFIMTYLKGVLRGILE